jgi:two-component system sensor histidine kinase KdpD
MVEADPAWIQKVLCNLLENAAKYSPGKDPIVVAAAITGEHAGGMVAISVADHGIGIHRDEQPLIFDKFYRARSRPQHVPGTGMGLSICRAIVEAHHGTMEVASEPGQGSVFTFYLPVSANQASARRNKVHQFA